MSRKLEDYGVPMKGMTAAEIEAAVERAAATRPRTFESYGIPMKPGGATPARSFASLGVPMKRASADVTRIAEALRSTTGLREHTFRSASGTFTVVGD